MATPYQQYDTSLLEPLFPKRTRRLEDLCVELAARSGQLAQGIHPVVLSSLGDLVRSMNCYYSNLIEGHRTTPRDIERALNQDLSSDLAQRNLQLETKAHIEVQRLIDTDANWLNTNPTSAALKAAFIEGEIARGRAASLTGYQTRQARSVLRRLLETGLLVSSSPKGPVRLAFPVVAAEQWLPRLWADT